MAEQQPLVLITDDNRTMRLILRKSLEESGFAVVEAESGERALEIFSQMHPDAILLDIEMAGMDGIVACAELRKLPECIHTPIIMVTSRGDPATIHKAFQAGATEFLVKPINWGLIGYHVQYMIRNSQNILKLQKSQDELNKAHAEIEKINMELEKRVVERTKELKKTTAELQTTLDSLRGTQSQLIESEKMAMLANLVESIAQEALTPINTSIDSIASMNIMSEKITSAVNQNTLTRSDLNVFLQLCSKVIESTHTNLQHASTTITNFRQLAIDKASEVRSRFRMKEYLEETMFRLRPVLDKAKVQVKINCPEELVITSYPGILFRVIMTLVVNSITYGYEPDEQGVITLDISTDHNLVTMRYSDNGKGMPKEILNNIFEPFLITRAGTKNRSSGLYLIHSQIKMILGGTIECASSPGHGVTFTITFPQ